MPYPQGLKWRAVICALSLLAGSQDGPPSSTGVNSGWEFLQQQEFFPDSDWRGECYRDRKETRRCGEMFFKNKRTLNEQGCGTRHLFAIPAFLRVLIRKFLSRTFVLLGTSFLWDLLDSRPFCLFVCLFVCFFKFIVYNFLLYFVCLFWFLVFRDRVFLCNSPGCSGTQFVNQDGSNSQRSTCLCLLLPPPPESWDYRHELPCPVVSDARIRLSASC